MYVRSGDSVVMFDEESVRFTSFVNSVEVALADAVYMGSDTLDQCHAEEATMLGDWASDPFHSGSMVALQ